MKAYKNNKFYKKFFKIFKISISLNNSMSLKFKMRDDLFYYINDYINKLCIFKNLIKKVFELVHDKIHHKKFHQIYDKLGSVFIQQLTKHLRNYIKYCPTCNLHRTERHKSLNELHSINNPYISFYTINMDFVVGLSKIDADANKFFTIIDKFSKKILFIPGKHSYKTENWTNIILKKLMKHDWKLFIIIMSNYDLKFVINFWRIIWLKLKILLFTTTAWYSQTDDQFKKTNQIIEIFFQYYLITYFNDIYVLRGYFSETKEVLSKSIAVEGLVLCKRGLQAILKRSK